MYVECWFTGNLYFKHGGSQNTTLSMTRQSDSHNHCRSSWLYQIQSVLSKVRKYYLERVDGVRGEMIRDVSLSVFGLC